MATEGKGISTDESRPPAYGPGWANRLAAFIDRLPGPSWLYYIGLGLVLLSSMSIVLWFEGAYPVGVFLPVHLIMPVMIAFQLMLLNYLGKRAKAELSTLRPALEISEEEYSDLQYRLTTLPARPTLLASLGAVVGIVVLDTLAGRPDSFDVLAGSPISEGVTYFVYLIGYWVFGTLLYHTVRLLRLIDRIYTEHTCIDLYCMRPLYSFSRLSALTAVTLAVPTYSWTALNPSSDLVGIGMLLILTALIVAAFVWPLLGAHRLLAEEKDRLLDQVSLRLKAATIDLHQRIDSGRLEGMTDLNMAIASLELEHAALQRIPTWPWQPETPRLLFTALALPLGLWIIQFVIQRMVAP